MGILNSDFIQGLARWQSTDIKVMGGIEVILALTFLFPALYAVAVGEDPSIFLIPILPIVIIGGAQYLLFAPTENYRSVNGVILVALFWIAMFAIGCIPYYLAGMNLLDAIFESVNGFTTTGSTTITDVFAWPESLMVWRSLTQWLGGIAVVMIFIYILPMFGMGRSFFTNELEGSGSSQFTMRLRTAGKSFIFVYLLLSLVNFILLIIAQAPFRDALCLSLTTISTGGLIMSNDSLMGANLVIQIITMVFMFVGAVNFYLHFKAIYGRNPKEYSQSRELKLLIIWYLVASLVLFIIYVIPKASSLGMDIPSILLDYKDVLFTVISLGTTTGASVIDYTLFPPMAIFILGLVMIIGGSAGSTSGGIKFNRIRILMRFFSNSLKNVLHPNAVYSIKLDGENLDESRVLTAVNITLLYLLTTLLATMVLLTQNLSITDALGLALGSITNAGVGFGNFGPTGSYAVLSDQIKIFLMFLMWMGRLEITLALVFFTRTFWTDVKMSYRSMFNFKKREHR